MKLQGFVRFDNALILKTQPMYKVIRKHSGEVIDLFLTILDRLGRVIFMSPNAITAGSIA